MADEVKTEQKPETQLRIDIKTLKPNPRAVVVFRDVEYAVLSLVDVPFSMMVDILSAAQAPRQEGENQAHANVMRLRRQLQIMVPDLTDAVADAMTFSEMERFLDGAMGVAENPQ